MDSRSNPTPKTIGRFRVESLLGVGGMGEVYKAVDPTLQRTVAVKTVRPDIDRPDYLERLYREAQACARLQHPNIVTVYEAGEIDGIVYIAMEYLKGEDLATVLRRRELNVEAKIKILVQVLDALGHAHSEDVVHRDIKPSNVYRQLDGSIKLVDFGLARMMRAETLTLSGAVMGTPHYASPEQLKGEHIDKRTDIYSVGAVAYEMFAGRRPFQTDYDSVATIVLKVISEPTPPMDVRLSRAFPEIEQIVVKAMAKSPDDRYQSAEEMRNALQAFLNAHRDQIDNAETQAIAIAKQTVSEAQELIDSGLKDEAQTLLTEALRINPDARVVSDLLDATRVRPPSTGATVPIERRAPAPAVVEPEPEPEAEEQAPPAGFAGAPTVVNPPRQYAPLSEVGETRLLTTPGQKKTSGTPTQEPAPVLTPGSSRNLWLGLGAAAALILIAAAIWMFRPNPPATIASVGTGGVTSAPPSTPTGGETPKEVPPQPPINKPVAPTDPDPTAKPPVDLGPTTSPKPKIDASPNPNPSAGASTGKSAPSGTGGASGSTTPGAGATPGTTAKAPDTKTPPAESPKTAKQMFFTNPGAGGAPGNAPVNTGLRYRLIQQSPDGGETDVDPSTTFKSGDKVRFSFESNIDGYLYVVQQGSSGRWTVLFPNPDINGGRNAIKRFEQYPVPNEAWFAFDDNPGTEQVFVFLSKDAVGQLPGFNRPVTKMESVPADTVQNLQQSIRSRDLVFEKDSQKQSQSTFVVNREEVGKAVAAVIQLLHK